MEAHVSEAKKRTVETFAGLIEDYPIVGALNMEGLPARQLQLMREQLRDACVIKMTKRRLINIALEKSEPKKEGISKLKEHLKGMPALLFTKENPFTLYKILKKNKSPAPAKPGQIAPKDIEVPAGPTPFAPGPIIGELGKFGIKTGVEGGKVAVKQPKVVCKEGEEISAPLASLLTRLQIYPMEVGLDLVAVYENGMILTKSVLDVDEEKYVSDIIQAAAGAFNLAMNAGVVNETTIEPLVIKAVSEANNLAVEAVIINNESAPLIIAKALREVSALASQLPDDVIPEELKLAKTTMPQQTVSEQPDKKDDSKESDDNDNNESDMAAGLGALFG